MTNGCYGMPENCDFFFSRCRLALTSIKEQFLFSINIFKSKQNNKKRYNEQNTPISESHLKTSGSGLKAYLKVPGCMSWTSMKASREDKKLFIFFSPISCIYFKKGKSWNYIFNLKA